MTNEAVEQTAEAILQSLRELAEHTGFASSGGEKLPKNSQNVLDLAEAYAWVVAPTQPHGGGGGGSN